MAGLCGGGGDDTSAELRQQEEERKARIREGTNAISRIFGGDVTDVKTTNPNVVMLPTPVTPGAPVQGPAARIPGLKTPATPAVQPRNSYIPFATGEPTKQTTKSTVPGQFDDAYFNNLEHDYLDYYLPQFQRQESDADRATKIRLARSGNLSGSVGARDTARLTEDKATARRGVIDSATKYGSDARKKIEDTRGNLIGQLEAGAGVENVAAQARSTADAATAPQVFSPLGDLFKNYTAAVANAGIAAGNPGAFPGADDYRRGLLFNIPSPGGSNRSATTVG